MTQDTTENLRAPRVTMVLKWRDVFAIPTQCVIVALTYLVKRMFRFYRYTLFFS